MGRGERANFIPGRILTPPRENRWWKKKGGRKCLRGWMDGEKPRKLRTVKVTHFTSTSTSLSFSVSLSLFALAVDYYAIFERTFLFLLAIDRIVGNLFFRALKVFETFSFGSFHNRYSDLRIGSFYCRSGRLSPTCVCLLGHLYDTSLLAKLIFPSVYNFLYN